MKLHTAEIDGLALHCNTRNVTRHQQIADVDRTFARIDFDSHSASRRDQNFRIALFTERDAGLFADYASDARVVAN